jgi:6-phosphogluconolactonase (cycloisomerase 2 family)
MVAASTSTSPVALVYVASTPKNSSTNEIVGFSAASNGKLTPVPGSPFTANVTGMAVNGKYLFAPNKSTPYIESYLIESSGTLKYATQTDYLKADPSSDCGTGGPVFLDHSGASLYLLEYAELSAQIMFTNLSR